MPDLEQAASDSGYTPFAALHHEVAGNRTALRAAITAAYRRDEATCVRWLLAQAENNPETSADANTADQAAIHALALQLVSTVRARRSRAFGVDALMQEFSLSSPEGVALMCLAEALLRIPDRASADLLIADKIGSGDWRAHLGKSPSWFVNAAAWGLLLTGKLVSTNHPPTVGAALAGLIGRGAAPLIRQGVNLAMRMLGNRFICGQHIQQALRNSRANSQRGYRYSYDMLGESALTAHDAARYFQLYEEALHAIGRSADGRGVRAGPGISVKLSALHPRYRRAQRERVLKELLPRLKQLVLLAKRYDIGITIDAEEAERLELSLDLFEALAFDDELAGFEGLGLAVQSYQKRSPYVIDYLIDLAQRSGRKFMLRLVKGAYWDTEIKRAQVDGMAAYPVYTRKVYTDLSYLVCAQKLLGAGAQLYPQFATHNAHTLASIRIWAERRGVTDYEFQCLYGMGETLYDQVVGPGQLNVPCRIYAPVGSHQTLLPYLVRRLLENGANASFVHQIVDQRIPIAALIADPLAQARKLDGAPHPALPLPGRLYAPLRTNSSGLDVADEVVLTALDAAYSQAERWQWQAGPLMADSTVRGAAPLPINPVLNPADRRDVVGQMQEASADDCEAALAAACAYAPSWQKLAPHERAVLLLRGADLFESHRLELMALAIREAGKSLPNAVAEVREAVDFLRYYAQQAGQTQPASATQALGVVVCISPWNFPLAIFTGQVSAALACGNVVLAKPAAQTSLMAQRAVQLLHAAGVPRAALQCLPGGGETVGARLVADARVQGVVFTGSTAVAQHINQALAQRATAGEIAFIAETGGQNAMIVDASALPEQVVQDVLVSAFDSAGQRCSALRVLCLQNEIADHTLALLRGALQELALGNPDRLATDIGPVIDCQAQQKLLAYIAHKHAHKHAHKQSAGHAIIRLSVPPAAARHGTFVAPCLIEISALSQLEGEVFGPVLHVLRYARGELPQLVAAINASGYGLTLGIHSRIEATIDFITRQAKVGNIYVNRSMVGAVVGVQPFGGEGKSGTGPKAGGPLYMQRLQRQAEVSPQRLQGSAELVTPPYPMPAVLALLGEWARQLGYPQLAGLAEQYATSSLFGSSWLLPGPTGERNTLSFAARGPVLCAPVTLPGLLNQLAALFATGNQAVLSTASALLLPDLPAAMMSLLTVMQEPEVAANVALALAEADAAAPLRLALASRAGAANRAIVPVIDTTPAAPIALWRLVAERAVCVNTTASGGNAVLMVL